MSELWSLLAVVVVGGLGSAACSAPYACETDIDRYAPDNLSADALSGTARLDTSRRAAEVLFRASLTDLPEVWQGSTNIVDATIAVRLSVEYEGEPKGNDGITEMPRIEAQLGEARGQRGIELSTGTFASGATGSFEMLPTCDDPGDVDCCVYGARSCTQDLRLVLRRLDLEPFPPVIVSWSATPSAHVSPCPLDDEVTAELGLEQVSR